MIDAVGLATELLLGRYTMPAPRYPTCLLARYERGVFEWCRKELSGISHGHRSEEYNIRILPHCHTLVKAIGNRLAYEAALDAGVEGYILDLYEAGVLLQSPDLGVDEIGIILSGRIHMERLAMNAISHRLEQLLDSIGAEPYITAPILTEESWEAFLDKLPQYGDKPYIGDIDAAASSRL